jgi:hypothetical protein
VALVLVPAVLDVWHHPAAVAEDPPLPRELSDSAVGR